MDLKKLKEKHNLREPDRGDLDDTTIEWRFGKPDYAKANLAFLKGKTQNHKAGMSKFRFTDRPLIGHLIYRPPNFTDRRLNQNFMACKQCYLTIIHEDRRYVCQAQGRIQGVSSVAQDTVRFSMIFRF